MTRNFILLIIRGGDRKKCAKRRSPRSWPRIPLSIYLYQNDELHKTNRLATNDTEDFSGRASLVLPRVSVALSGREERATNRKKTHGVFVLVSGVRGGR